MTGEPEDPLLEIAMETAQNSPKFRDEFYRLANDESATEAQMDALFERVVEDVLFIYGGEWDLCLNCGNRWVITGVDPAGQCPQCNA